jgi:predicted amidohydrolase
MNNQQQEDCRLTVAVLSLNIALGDVSENLRRAAAMVDALPRGVDVAVLPELFTTSFMKDTDALLALAEPTDGPTMQLISSLARERNMMIAGSYIARDGNSYVNRGFMAMPDGATHFYDKHHLFCLSPEAKLLKAGEARPPIVAFRGWNITMNICYELRFPVWERVVSNEADMVLLPANWPTARSYAWRHLLIARSIENQVVMVGADRSGIDDFGHYDGMSLMTDEYGRQIAPPPAEQPEGVHPTDNLGQELPTAYGNILLATFSLNQLRNFRKQLPVVRDADRFALL